MARRFWPNADPIGQWLVIGHGMRTALDQDPPRQIVGIVGNVREQRLNLSPCPAMYVPATQLPAGVLPFLVEQLPLAWIVRTTVDPRLVADAVERTLERTTNLPVSRVRSMREVAAASIVRTRFDMYLMLVFGASAAFLAALGVYGFVSLLVKQRSRDFGIRIALGAQPGDIARWVLTRGLGLAAIGVAAGCATAWLSGRVLASLLFGVTSHDGAVFSVVPLAMATLVLVVTWGPARRAARVDPAAVLRDE